MMSAKGSVLTDAIILEYEAILSIIGQLLELSNTNYV